MQTTKTKQNKLVLTQGVSFSKNMPFLQELKSKSMFLFKTYFKLILGN